MHLASRTPNRRRWSYALLGLTVAALLAGCGPTGPRLDPVGAPLSLEVDEDASVAFNLTTVRGDADGGTFTIVTPPRHGSLTGTAPALTYVPDADFLGSDSFTYTVTAGSRTSAETTVTIDVLNTPFYAITRGNFHPAEPGNATSSRLFRVDERGRIGLVGDTGHVLLAIAVDPTDGAIFATTQRVDMGPDGCDSCLMSLNATTGAATVVGSIDLDDDLTTVEEDVNGLAFTSDGTLYGYISYNDELVLINKGNGAATVVGPSGIDVGPSGLNVHDYGFWTDGDDRLWLLNHAGDAHTLDTTTGAADLIHTGAEIAATAGFDYGANLRLRGDRDPATGKYWGVPAYSNHVAGGLARLAIDLGSATYIDAPSVATTPTIFDIAFVRE